MEYSRFIEILKSLNSTEEILLYIFAYFKEDVSYNYDQLQVVKYNNQDEPSLIKIREFIQSNKGCETEKFKKNLIKMFDEAFISIEGRPLSVRNKKEWFKDFGKIIHHEATPARKSGFLKIAAKDAYDEIVSVVVENINPVYQNGMLIDGVCGEYSIWIQKILSELNIPCFFVRGRGTTSHAWNLVYIEEKNKWVNFDMTMVRFYLDGFSKKYGEPDEWIFASMEEIFNNQPQRKIEQLIDSDGNVCYKGTINGDNYEELIKYLFELNDKKVRR